MKMNFSDLIEQRLVRVKRYENGLRVVKYDRKVFYDGLWGVDDRLLDARGLVVDDEDNIVVWPFTKVFNHHEQGTECDLNTPVVIVEKVNGFLGCVTPTEKYGTIFSTTGSLDSDFVQLIKKHLTDEQLESMEFAAPGHTFMFEIVDETDPHIIPTEPGAYLIGCRRTSDGHLFAEWSLDRMADVAGFKRPTWTVGTFGNALEQAATCKHEGFLIRQMSPDSNETPIMKLKSPHYLSKKALMRLGNVAVLKMFENPEAFRERLDEEFYGVFEFILAHGDQYWPKLSEQERRNFLEGYFER